MGRNTKNASMNQEQFRQIFREFQNAFPSDSPVILLSLASDKFHEKTPVGNWVYILGKAVTSPNYSIGTLRDWVRDMIPSRSYKTLTEERIREIVREEISLFKKGQTNNA